MLTGLHGLRFTAALSVLLFHCLHYGIALRVIPGDIVRDTPYFLGTHGVALFFALSGFLMAMVSERTGALRFIAHRALRIYPPFLAAVAITLVAQKALTGSTAIFNLSALTLVPVGVHTGLMTPLRVEWTLVYEISFYVVVEIGRAHV